MPDCPAPTRLPVVNSTVVQLTGSGGSGSLTFQRLGGRQAGLVNLVSHLRVHPDLFSSGGCRPEIYLVRGRGSCSGGGAGQVTATRLAEVHRPGAGQSLVPVQWAELQDSCLLVARRDQGCETVRLAAPHCSAISSGPDLTRTVNTLNFNGFSVLFSGRPSEWSENHRPTLIVQFTARFQCYNVLQV